MLCLLFSIVLRPRYDVRTKGNLFRPSCGQTNVSVGQRGTGDERQSCFGMVQSYLAECECALRQSR